VTIHYSFDPIAGPEARMLILGSMPGAVSLQAGEYYAHPRNAFWHIIEALFGISTALPYGERCGLLLEHRIAVWDVLRACRRPGSLDSSIVEASIVANDFRSFFAAHRGIEFVYFNGAKAESAYRRYVLAKLPDRAADLALMRLPSTSPAHASLNFEAKLAAWGIIAQNAMRRCRTLPK
jgi:hypoxanthine-DNA glycosylase